MSNGLAALLGFDCPANFNLPYISGSITEFWRRWHITLSGWFRDYIYIPLGGNRKGQARQLLNMFLVWAATGASGTGPAGTLLPGAFTTLCCSRLKKPSC